MGLKLWKGRANQGTALQRSYSLTTYIGRYPIHLFLLSGIRGITEQYQGRSIVHKAAPLRN